MKCIDRRRVCTFIWMIRIVEKYRIQLKRNMIYIDKIVRVV